ncbi:MAG: hypothetical protein ACOVP8_04500, partial [Phycisphaerales bacterium]
MSDGETNLPPHATRDLSDDELAIVHDAVRNMLDLPNSAPVGPAECARVTELYVYCDDMSDAILAWLCRKDSPFTALTELNLDYAPITDHGLAFMAASDAPFRSLTTLILSDTDITDKGLAYLASIGSPLNALTRLDV